ncbi:xanthine dehydrogenase/oxidase-like [Ptychodera flava]|uniref:xanthine dehydrogenase/oxidase-like n=1 Tax=Ptychodera flava TaxID=63121 RepID=UPI00396A0165
MSDAVAGKNNIFLGSADQKIFADDEVTCVGHIIGGIVAEDMHIARRAVKRIDVDYEELEAILTIEDSIEKGSFYHDRDIDFEGGDISAGFAASDDIIEGETRLGEQEHFYMEPHSYLAIPDVGEYTMELHAAGHDLCSLKYAIANALGSDYSKINCKTTRLGGSFGGKDSYAILFGTICAVAANTVKKPVRLVLERDEDMKISGKRMGCLAKYKAGFTKQGDIKAVDLHVYFHGGHTEEHQFFTMLWAYYSFGNVYNICNLRYAGRLCRTNMPSNTAFRGYGQPESVFIMESLLTQIAAKCNIGQTKIREIQFQKEGDLTIHGDQVKNSCINQCWRDCLLRSDFYNRQEEVLKFNRMHKWLKKGLAVVPVAYGFGPPFKKGGQGFAYVQVQMDGSVLISSGGVEMGQGLHTKLIQIASYELDVPTDYIYMSDTSTNVSPFFAATIQSVSTEVSGKAVKIACEKIREQMEPYVSANPNGTWKDRVRQVYDDGEIILATGHSAIAPEKDSNMPFRYYSYGTACSEVELDCLTGEHRLLRTDIVMDCGRSLNPAIDIGQIEGAFVQGYGYFMREEIMWSDKGELINSGPGMYRLPRVQDIPREFNVEILKNSDNPCNIYSSKGIGEPPLSLAVSAFFALKEAIRSARRDIGIEEDFSLDAPAVPRRVLQACGNQLLKK